MHHTISAVDNNVRLIGDWRIEKDSVRHVALTDHLNDSLAVEWRGTAISTNLACATDRKIAVVVRLNGKPIDPTVAGRAIQWGEGQSFIFVEGQANLELVAGINKANHRIELLTRSDKLICYSFTIKTED